MKKPAINGQSIKQFFVQHGEKLGLGVFAVAGCFLIYLGVTRENYNPQRQPDGLRDLAQQVKRSVDEDDHWEEIAEELPTVPDYPERASAAQRPVEAGFYAFGPLENKSHTAIERREDPELYAPEQIFTTGVLGALAVRSDARTTNLIAELENAEEIEVEVKPQRSSRQRRPRRGRGGSEPSSAEGYYGEFGEPMESSEPYGDYAEGGGRSGPVRRLDRKYDDGYRPQASGMNYGGAMSESEPSGSSYEGGAPGQRRRGSQIVPKTGYFIAGAAVYPHERLADEYERMLASAKGYDSRRDRPTYVGYQLERADVTDRAVEDLEDGDWVTVLSHPSGRVREMTKDWAGRVPDPVHPAFKDRQLTMPIPPLLLKDYREFAVHPAIPLQAPGRARRGAALEEEIDADAEAQDAAESEAADAIERGVLDPNELDMRRRRRGGEAYGEGSGGYGESYDSSYESGGYGSYESEGYGSYEESGYGESSYGYGSRSGGTAAVVPEFKLIRFYDFRDPRNKRSIQPGRKYVYRIRVALEDPNYPGSGNRPPPLNYLSADALTRVQQQMQADKEAGGSRTSYRWSEYSEPSEPTELPPEHRWVAGPVAPGSTTEVTVNGKKIQVKRESDSGEVVAVRWDFELATELAAPFTATPGSVLNRTGALDVVDPITLAIKTLPEGEVETGSVLLDIFGGEALAAPSRDESLAEPGEILVFDVQRGELAVLDETDDFREYRRYTFKDEIEAAEEAAQRAQSRSEPEAYGYGEGAYGP